MADDPDEPEDEAIQCRTGSAPIRFQTVRVTPTLSLRRGVVLRQLTEGERKARAQAIAEAKVTKRHCD